MGCLMIMGIVTYVDVSECGMDEPEDEFHAVRDFCPIKLDKKTDQIA